MHAHTQKAPLASNRRPRSWSPCDSHAPWHSGNSSPLPSSNCFGLIVTPCPCPWPLPLQPRLFVFLVLVFPLPQSASLVDLDKEGLEKASPSRGNFWDRAGTPAVAFSSFYFFLAGNESLRRSISNMDWGQICFNLHMPWGKSIALTCQYGVLPGQTTPVPCSSLQIRQGR